MVGEVIQPDSMQTGNKTIVKIHLLPLEATYRSAILIHLLLTSTVSLNQDCILSIAGPFFSRGDRNQIDETRRALANGLDWML
jgi:hypothetical protein